MTEQDKRMRHGRRRD